MSVSDFLWSERARREFAALFDDANYSDAFRRSVADALVRGWSNNRDKPFWALSIVVAALSASGGGDDGMDIIWQSAGDIREQYLAMPEDALSAIGCSVSENDGTLLLSTPDGEFRLTNHRLRVLRKLAEFFLCCDEFAHANDVMGLLSGLAGAPSQGSYADVKEATRAFARIGYRFRTENFLDGHASSAFSVINSYLAKRDFVFVDHTIFEFWADSGNERYKTYEATFQAFANFVAAMEDARAVNAGANARDIQDPALSGAVAGLVANDDGGLEDVTQDLCSHLDDDRDDGEVIEKATDPAVLGDANLRLFGRKDIVILSRLVEFERFATEHRLASLRLLSFHPVQSGISNGLRTGKWKVPLSDRVTCQEAKSYGLIIEDLADLQARATSWLEVAFALASGEVDDDSAAHDVRTAGLATLSKSRSKALQKDPETLRRAFLEVTPALIQARELSERFAGLFRRLFPDSETCGMDNQFVSDKGLFAAEFIRRYLAGDGSVVAEAASSTDQGVPGGAREEQDGSKI